MNGEREPVTIFLAGDVMTGRGIDQIQEHPGNPELHEAYVKDAGTYVELAERATGMVSSPVGPHYIWGDALDVLAREQPAARIVNLETSITVGSDFWPGKGVHYRMHPANVGCLQAAELDAVVLSNNHTLDFDRRGLLETLEVLEAAGIEEVGAGRDWHEASRPARLELGAGNRLLLYGVGDESSGIPGGWAATPTRAGVWLLDDLTPEAADEVAGEIREEKAPGDIVVVSIHWGSNWDWEIPEQHVAFAHRLIDGGVDVVHGHSSHHVRPVEIYQGKLILYGCGNLITDYEGIASHRQWRGDLGALYFVTLSPSDASLVQLRMVPTQMKKMQLTHPSTADVDWLRDTLNRISRPFGSWFSRSEDGALVLHAPEPARPSAT
jgi:poly-gamma-glutamate synthesis protein (capsule biosynthesis protein)